MSALSASRLAISTLEGATNARIRLKQGHQDMQPGRVTATITGATLSKRPHCIMGQHKAQSLTSFTLTFSA